MCSLLSAEEDTPGALNLLFCSPSDKTEVYEESAHHGDDVRQRFRIAYPHSDDCQSFVPSAVDPGAEPGRRRGHVEYGAPKNSLPTVVAPPQSGQDPGHQGLKIAR